MRGGGASAVVGPAAAPSFCSATSLGAHRPGRRLRERQPAGHGERARGARGPLSSERVPQAPDPLPGCGSELRKPPGDLSVTPGLRVHTACWTVWSPERAFHSKSLAGCLLPTGGGSPAPQRHPDLPTRPSPRGPSAVDGAGLECVSRPELPI